MTSPNSVGQVSVEIIAEAKALARSLKAAVEKAFRGLDVQQQIDQSAAGAEVRVPVHADFDGSSLAARLKAAVAAASARARATVEVDVDVDRQGGLSRLGSMLRGLGGSGGGIGGLVSQFGDLSGAIQRSVGSSAQLGGSLAGAFTTATGPVGIVIGLLTVAAGAMAALAAAAVAAVPAITAVAGAAAAIPGALVGAGAAFGALSLGFKGIAEAFKPKAGGGGGGGSAVNQAKQIAAASRQVEAARRGIAAANRQVDASERALAAAHRGVEAAELRLADAQKRAQQAQQAISRAREEAVESIDDLNRSLRGARLSEEEAALGVTDALRELEQVRLTGKIPDIQRADLAYRQALQTLEESRDTTADLAKETDAANKAGVEGSEQVQDAYRDQQEALRAVADAQVGVIEAGDSLKSAQDGVAAAMDGVKSAADGLTSAQESLAQAQQKVASGGGGVAKEVIKLAPAAQAFVNAIKDLKPAFEGLRLDVQQKLFAGLDKTVTNLGKAWIPALRKTLGDYATTFNGLFKDLGASVSTPKFIGDVQAGAEGARKALERIGGAVTEKMVPAFGALARASAPFLEKLGDGLAKIVEKFSDWVLEGEKSGALADFFDRASAAMAKIGESGYQVARIIGGLFAAITGSSAKTGQKSALDTFNASLRDLADWLNDPANQQKVTNFFTGLDQAVRSVGSAIGLVASWIGSLQRFVDRLGVWKTEIQAKLRSLFGFEDGVEPGQNLVEGLISGLGTALGKLWGKLAGWLWEGPDSLIGRIKSGLGIASPSKVMATIGGYLIDGLINGVKNRLAALRTTAISIKNTVTGALSSAGTWLLGAGRNAVYGLQNGIRSIFAGLRTTAGGLRTTVVNALSNSIGWLVNTGKNVVYGLWNGLASLGGWLWNKVQNFASTYVTRAINSALGVNSPSKVAMKIGRAVPEGLAMGIDADAGRVEAAAQRLAAAALPQIQDATLGMGWEADAAIRGSLAVADQREALLSWKKSASGDQVLDALARLIDVSYNSDVEAAFTRTRR